MLIKNVYDFKLKMLIFSMVITTEQNIYIITKQLPVAVSAMI